MLLHMFFQDGLQVVKNYTMVFLNVISAANILFQYSMFGAE